MPTDLKLLDKAVTWGGETKYHAEFEFQLTAYLGYTNSGVLETLDQHVWHVQLRLGGKIEVVVTLIEGNVTLPLLSACLLSRQAEVTTVLHHEFPYLFQNEIRVLVGRFNSKFVSTVEFVSVVGAGSAESSGSAGVRAT
eukprot:5019065-Amphidinium_carterae.1